MGSIPGKLVGKYATVHLPLPHEPSNINTPAQSSIYLPTDRPSDPAMFSACLSFSCYDPTACLIGHLLPTLIPRWRKKLPHLPRPPGRLPFFFFFFTNVRPQMNSAPSELCILEMFSLTLEMPLRGESVSQYTDVSA